MAISKPSKRILEFTLHNKVWLHEKYCVEELSSLKIAKLLNCSKYIVLYWMKKLEINSRTTSEALSGPKNLNYGKKRDKSIVDKIRKANTGKCHTEETKEKISKANKGRAAWNKGIPCAEEQKRSQSIAMIGKKPSEETRKKLSKAQRGRKHTKETKEKISSSNRGELGNNWKGGIYPLHKAIRKIAKYNYWRSEIFKRDDYTCQVCNKKGCKLNADHIKSFSLILKENNIKTIEQALSCENLRHLNNGRTLCVECHKKTDSYGTGGI